LKESRPGFCSTSSAASIVSDRLPAETNTAVGAPHSSCEIFPARPTRTSISARFTDPTSMVGSANPRSADSTATPSATAPSRLPQPNLHPTLRI
jgi:hypothetical protein